MEGMVPVYCIETERRSNNEIKRTVLMRAYDHCVTAGVAGGALSLFDIGCGRGGDIHKWVKLGIPCVYGSDPSYDAVAEARVRFGDMIVNDAGGRKKGVIFSYQFGHMRNPLGRPDSWFSGEDKRFDIVSCQFAAQFYAPDNTAVLMDTVVRRMKSCGVFVGTLMDGDAVLRALPVVGDTIEDGPMRVKRVSLTTIRVRVMGTPYFDNGYCDRVVYGGHGERTMKGGEEEEDDRMHEEPIITRDMMRCASSSAGLREVYWERFCDIEHKNKNKNKNKNNHRTPPGFLAKWYIAFEYKFIFGE